MNTKKATSKGSPKKSQTKNTTIRPRLSLRENRLLTALLKAQDGLSREQADRATPASNGPHYVEQLRRKLRLEIPCRRVDFVTIDGVASWHGHYWLTTRDRERLEEALS